MQRKLFFFFERLQITRRERLTIGSLAICLLVLSTLNLMIDQEPVYDEHEYEKLEAVFEERSRQALEEEREILARYEPAQQTQQETGATFTPPQDTGTKFTPPQDTGTTYAPPQDTGTTYAPPRDTVREESDSEVEPQGEKINLNQADAEMLQELPGIGPAYAGRILEWREENGYFQSKEQLMEIRGIGEKTLEQLKPYIEL